MFFNWSYELTQFHMHKVLLVMSQYLQNHFKPVLEFLKGKYPQIDQHTQVQDVCMTQVSWHTVCMLEK